MTLAARLSLLALLLVTHSACVTGESTATNAASNGTPDTPGGSDGNTLVGPASIVLQVAEAYLIQVQQRDDGSIPMVAGRDAYLRVFLTADRDNTATPEVRARLFSGSTKVYETVAQATAAGVPKTAGSDGTWNASYNFRIPAALLTPGVSLLVDTDPNAAISGARRGTFPQNGNAMPVKVLQVAPFNAVAVTIATPNPAGGAPLVGNLNAGNLKTYYELALQILPISKYSLSLRPGTFFINRILKADGTNWGAALGDLQTAQFADPNGASTYWFGIARLSYTGAGVCGIDVTPGFTGLAEDDAFLNMAWAQQSVAHEEGHAFGLQHAPCGGPANVDPSWPSDPAHAGARLGTWGVNVAQAVAAVPAAATPALFAPTSLDIMSYCDTAWMSDFNFNKALTNQSMNARVAGGGLASAQQKPEEPSPHLVVSGHIEAGLLQIDHAIRTLGLDIYPPKGPYRLTASDANGTKLFSVRFAPTPIGARATPGTRHAPPSEGFFTMSVPLAEDQWVAEYTLDHPDRPSTRKKRSSRGEAQSRRHKRAPQQATLSLEAFVDADGLVTIKWDPTLYKKAFVQETEQHIIGVVLDGYGKVLTDRSTLLVRFTDGLDSIQQSVEVHR